MMPVSRHRGDARVASFRSGAKPIPRNGALFEKYRYTHFVWTGMVIAEPQVVSSDTQQETACPRWL